MTVAMPAQHFKKHQRPLPKYLWVFALSSASSSSDLEAALTFEHNAVLKCFEHVQMHSNIQTDCICKLLAHKAEQKESEEGERLICAKGSKVRIAETQRFSRRSTHVLVDHKQSFCFCKNCSRPWNSRSPRSLETTRSSPDVNLCQ